MTPSRRPKHRPLPDPTRRLFLRLASRPLNHLARGPLRRLVNSPLRRLASDPLRRLARRPFRRLALGQLRRLTRNPLRRLTCDPLRRLAHCPLHSLAFGPLLRLALSQLHRLAFGPLRPTPALAAILCALLAFLAFTPRPALGQSAEEAGLEAPRARVEALQARVVAAEAELAKLKTIFEELSPAESAIPTADGLDLDALSGVLRASADDAEDLVSGDAVSPEFPGRLDVLAIIRDRDRAPGFDDLEALTGLYFDEIEASGRVVRRQGEFIDHDGTMSQGEILRAGQFLTAFRRDDEIGFLKVNARGDRLAAVSARPSRRAAGDIAAWLDGAGAGLLPLDLSHGAALERLVQRGDWLDWLESGGLLVWPILAVGALALLLVLERLVSLGRLRGASGRSLKRLDELARSGRWDELREECAARARYPACRVVAGLLEQRGQPREVLDSALEEAVLRELPRLERFLPTLSVLAAIAPLLGLLGTVTGMIATFHAITIFGAGDPRAMSGGISEALITTQLGLAVAIPVMLAHHLLERRVDGILADMEEKGGAFVLLLLRDANGGGHA